MSLNSSPPPLVKCRRMTGPPTETTYANSGPYSNLRSSRANKKPVQDGQFVPIRSHMSRCK